MALDNSCISFVYSVSNEMTVLSPIKRYDVFNIWVLPLSSMKQSEAMIKVLGHLVGGGSQGRPRQGRKAEMKAMCDLYITVIALFMVSHKEMLILPRYIHPFSHYDSPETFQADAATQQTRGKREVSLPWPFWSPFPIDRGLLCKELNALPSESYHRDPQKLIRKQFLYPSGKLPLCGPAWPVGHVCDPWQLKELHHPQWHPSTPASSCWALTVQGRRQHQWYRAGVSESSI